MDSFKGTAHTWGLVALATLAIIYLLTTYTPPQLAAIEAAAASHSHILEN